MPRLKIEHERFALAQTFTISRGSKTAAEVITVTLSDGLHAGRGEGVPYARYGESLATVIAQLEAMQTAVAQGLDRHALLEAMPPGAARNALDCALWDFEAKLHGRPVAERLPWPQNEFVLTAYTISLATPEAMHEAAQRVANRPLLKIKLGSEDDRERIQAVRMAAPHARLIVDANEGWRAANLERHLSACEEAGIELIEQPLPADDDAALRGLHAPMAICADESLHGEGGPEKLDALAGKYTALNIKLDKAGGLTAALQLIEAARERGFELMIGCMVGSSLAMAPARLLAPVARWIDLDGPLLLAEDRSPGLAFDAERGLIGLPTPALWG